MKTAKPKVPNVKVPNAKDEENLPYEPSEVMKFVKQRR
jgi:hypothetical protein